MSAFLNESKTVVLIELSRTYKQAAYNCNPQHLTRRRGDVVTHLWRHVADSSDAVGILADVHRVGLGVVFDGQTEVGDAALTVVLHQNVLRLEIAMRNLRFGSLPCNNKTKHVTRCKSMHRVVGGFNWAYNRWCR